MPEEDDVDRHSHAIGGTPVVGPGDKARREAENGVRQVDAAMALVAETLASTASYRLRLSQLVMLNRVAVEGLEREPGALRTTEMAIFGSRHTPPPWQEVPRLVEDMLDYVNTNTNKPPIHLAAYLMWRINWIHPFYDGNGRTARMVAYTDLCIRLGGRLPGPNTVPDQIVANKKSYYQALEAADDAWHAGRLDVSAMEGLLSATLAAQFMAALRQAEGAHPPR